MFYPVETHIASITYDLLTEKSMVRTIILCGGTLNVFQQKVIQSIMDEPEIIVSAVLIDSRPRASFRKRFKKNLKRGRGGYMLIMFFKHLRGKKDPAIGTKDFFSRRGVPCIESPDPYTKEAVDSIAPFAADMMILIGGFGIVKEPLFSAIPGGILSYHHGDMRKYRGQPPGFWELYNGEKEMGVTVQRIAAGLDKGTPIEEITVPILTTDNETSLYGRARDMSEDMMRQAILDVQDPDYLPGTIDKYGPVYTLPNMRQYLTLKWRLLFRRMGKRNHN